MEKNRFLNSDILRVVLTTIITLIIFFLIVIGLLWYFRSSVSKYIVDNYLSEPQISENITRIIEKNPELNQVVTNQNISDTEKENSVINAVSKARPAVVSIVATKNVSIINTPNSLFGPWQDLFPQFFPQNESLNQNNTQKREIGSGSGFIISQDGLIVTNRHVVSDATAEYKVMLNNGKEYSAKVLARDPVLDVAFIKIEASGLPYLNLANSDNLQVGQTVIAIGNALGEFQNTVSVGVVSDLERSIVAGNNFGEREYLDKVIQTDAAINPGNSGGPLLDLRGDVVGINVAVVEGSSSIGFSLPINSVKSAIDSVKSIGKIVRPYLGIRYIPITAELKTKNNLSVDYGILVQKGQTATDLAVIPGSPADKAGIKENDIILEIDGQKIDQKQSFVNLIRSKNIGDTIRVKILSQGVEKTLLIKLDQAPDNV